MYNSLMTSIREKEARQVFSKHENRVGENIEGGSCLKKMTTHPS